MSFANKVSGREDLGKCLEHCPSIIQGAFVKDGSHGPCIRHLETVSYLSNILSGISALTIASTCSIAFILSGSSRHSKICACGNPRFCHSIT